MRCGGDANLVAIPCEARGPCCVLACNYTWMSCVHCVQARCPDLHQMVHMHLAMQQRQAGTVPTPLCVSGGHRLLLTLQLTTALKRKLKTWHRHGQMQQGRRALKTAPQHLLYPPPPQHWLLWQASSMLLRPLLASEPWWLRWRRTGSGMSRGQQQVL
jgi:hypothetical protein